MIVNSSKIFYDIDQYCQKHGLLPHKAKIILGLSGGPDSMLLLHYLKTQQQTGNISLLAAHLDHEWRENSSNDVEFCARETARLEVPFIAIKASSLAFKPKFNGSKEDLGRSMRRYFFESLRKQEGADLIALAHQMQDQEETFFIRMIRGCSLAGLTGIQPVQDHYIRPLLETSRSDILSYLENNNIPFLIDPSNASDLFLRNRIRNKLLPIVRTIDPRFDKNFARMLTQLQETNEFLDQLTESSLAAITDNNQKSLCTKRFNLLHPVLKKRVIISWLIQEKVPFSPSEQFLQEIIKFFSQQSGKTHRLHTSWAISKKRGVATIEKFSSGRPEPSS